ncbi:unnamed protein product [Prorocentrum cordatum]|uniref:Armadillo repeat-containing protein 1 n=1 Tax=Prorocentrum cordatum TaxID=2364126 RepID=A0ABN9TCV7_9DINO|nr:unnamed protein product [Polarella glacialis]
MAADQALAAVRQIQALAEGPQTPEMRACLGQVVAAVLAFLDHPDARVRLHSARALLKLTAGYPGELAAIDLGRARGALKRSRVSRAAGTADADAEEIEAILVEVLEAGAANGASAASTAASTPLSGAVASAAAASSSWGPRAARAAPNDAEGRGEVVLKVGAESWRVKAKVKAVILERVVAVSGVVSVTFEGSLVIVSTRSAAVAADAVFLADVLAAMRAEGIEGISLVSAGGTSAGAAAPAGPLGVQGPDAPAPAAATPAAAGSPAGPHVPGEGPDEDESQGEPGYLDDDDEDELVMSGSGGAAVSFGAPAGPSPLVGGGGPQWSFFSQSNWMTGRKVQEFDDDPTIAARLAKAKRREEAKKEESRSRLGFVTSWLGRGS